MKDFQRAIQETPQGVLLELQVSALQRGFAFKAFNEWNHTIKLNVTQPARNGKANKEIEKELGKMFSAKVKILSGKTNTRKKVLVSTSPENVLRALHQQLEL
ncbi:MAG: YggU family protein [Candidatus Diapherotrites archaeon]|nr:YggU family protein [Candidatus Diapherotrites archaeon]